MGPALGQIHRENQEEMSRYIQFYSILLSKTYVHRICIMYILAFYCFIDYMSISSTILSSFTNVDQTKQKIFAAQTGSAGMDTSLFQTTPGCGVPIGL